MALRIYGNRPLRTLGGEVTRPTTGRVREAVFNILASGLGPGVVDSQWLDLCAGNGVMGAEALCRGAARVVGIERSPQACQIIRHNWQQVCRPPQGYQVIQGDIRQQLPRLKGQQFDYIYFDPPYQSGLYEDALQGIAQGHLLGPHGCVIVEHDHHWPPPPTLAHLTCLRQRSYGRSALVFYGWAGEGEA